MEVIDLTIDSISSEGEDDDDIISTDRPVKREKLTVAANNRYVCKYLKSSVRYYRYFFVVHVVVAGYFYYIVYGITDGST